MTEPFTNYPLERYISNYEQLANFKGNHLFMATLTPILGGVAGIVVYLILTQNSLPLNFGMTGNVVASILAGAVITPLAIIGILLHYTCKLVKQDTLSNEESLLKALTDSSTANVVSNEKNSDGQWVAKRFGHLLHTQFPDENWQGMMVFFEKKFFNSACFYSDQTKLQVYDAFFQADPSRFIFNYYEMQGLGLLPKTTQFLKDYIVDDLKKATPEDWTQILIQIDNAYFRKTRPVPEKTQMLLLNEMIKLNRAKFNQAICLGEDDGVFSSEFRKTIAWNRPS